MKIFSHSLGYCFVRLKVSFAWQKLLSFLRFHVLIIELSAWAVGVLFRKLSAVLVHSSYFPLSPLPGSVCLVLCYGLWSTWTWVLSVWWIWIYWHSTCNHLVWPASFVKECCLSLSSVCFWVFHQKSDVWIYVCINKSIPLINVSVFMPVLDYVIIIIAIAL